VFTTLVQLTMHTIVSLETGMITFIMENN